MASKIPMIKLKKDERLWLTENYRILKQNERPDFRKIWQKLYGKISKTFRPPSMDARVVGASGEELKLLGVIALERNYNFLDKCNNKTLPKIQ
jgi:hypothetical protein